MNAASVRRYDSTNRAALPEELRRSLDELRAYLQGLPPEEWEADRGVRHGPSPITIQNTVEVLIRDYGHHTDRIRAWASEGR